MSEYNFLPCNYQCTAYKYKLFYNKSYLSIVLYFLLLTQMESEFQPSSPLRDTTRSTSPPPPSTPLTKEYLKGLLTALNAGDNLANLQATHLWSDILNCIEKLPTSSVRYHVRTYKQVFTGNECVIGLFTFLQAKSEIYPAIKQASKEHVISLCQQLLELGHLQPASKSSKSQFQPDTHPYRFSRNPHSVPDSPAISECSSEVSLPTGKTRRGNRYHPYLKMAKRSVKKIVGKPREKKLIPEEDQEWVDTVMSRILTHVDMPYLDKVITSKELTDDVIKQNLGCIMGEEDGYIPQWIIRIFDWLTSYTKDDNPSEISSEHFKISSSEDNFPSALLTRICRHFEMSVGPLIHHSILELFETIGKQFNGDSIPEKAIYCLQLFLLLPAPHKRLHMQFLFSNLARLSNNENITSPTREERLIYLIKLFMPCITRPKEKVTRHQCDYTALNNVLTYMATNSSVAFNAPKDIKELYQDENKDFSFQDFLSQKQSNFSPLSKCLKAVSETTETRGELAKLLDNIVRDASLTKEKKDDLLHQFSVVYPEIYSQNMLAPVAYE